MSITLACPNCHRLMEFISRHSIGRKPIEGFYYCEKCSVQIGRDMVGFEEDDIRETIVNNLNNQKFGTVYE